MNIIRSKINEFDLFQSFVLKLQFNMKLLIKMIVIFFLLNFENFLLGKEFKITFKYEFKLKKYFYCYFLISNFFASNSHTI